MKRVAIAGASGFVGAALVERLHAVSGCEIVPLVHSSGNAWRVSRLPLQLRSVDLLSPDSVKAAIQGCTHVVNCARGDEQAMLKGFRTLVDVCADLRVERFVHLSSVAVYGDPPPADSRDETGTTNPARGSYGWIKLQQDTMLQKAASRLPSVALCPPNIGGPYSAFLQAVLGGLRRGRIPLVDGGKSPCNLVDVDNLVQAIELALDRGPEDGRRLFVTDERIVDWSTVVDELRPLLPENAPAAPALSADALRTLIAGQRPPPASLWRSVKHLMSGEVRTALRRDPLLAKVDGALRSTFALLGRSAEERMRLAIEAPGRAGGRGAARDLDLRLAAQQFRMVVHSSQRAAESLGYKPRRTFEASMRAFREWHERMTGADSPFRDLYAQIGA